MRIEHDPDEWMTVFTQNGPGAGYSVSQVRRSKEDVLRIKAERRQREEDEILRKADAIRTSRRAVSDRMALKGEA